MKKSLAFALSVFAVAATTNVSNAAIITFNTPGAFNAATSGLTFTSENFTTATPGLLSFGTSHGFNGFSASAVNSANSDMAFYVAPNPFSGAQHAPFTSSQYLGWSEDHPQKNGSGTFGPTVTITFDDPQSAVAFDFLDSDFSDEYRLFVDGVEVPFPSATNTSLDNNIFFGLVDNMGTFTTLRFTEQGTSPGGFVEEFGVDNIRFAAAPVPEPASIAVWSVLLLTVVGATFYMRRRKLQPATN